MYYNGKYIFGTKILNCDEVKRILQYSLSGESNRSIAEKFKVSKDTIRRIVLRKTYKECD